MPIKQNHVKRSYQQIEVTDTVNKNKSKHPTPLKHSTVIYYYVI